MKAHPFVFDSDASCEEAIALWSVLALRLPMKAAIVTYGAVSFEQACDNVIRILALGDGKDIPLFLGATATPRKHAGFEKVILPWRKKAGNGLCDIILPPATKKGEPFSAEALMRLSKDTGCALDYFVCGPATTAARIVRDLGEMASGIIRRIVMLSGTIEPPSKNRIKADFNIAIDPFAVDDLMRSKVPILFVPHDVTASVALTLDDIMLLCPMNRVAASAHQIMIEHCKKFTSEPTFRLHSPCAAFGAQDGETFLTERLSIVLKESNAMFARMIPDKKGVSCGVYTPSLSRQIGIREEVLRALSF